MNRDECLLMFLGLPSLSSPAPIADPVRIMKGIFLFTQEGGPDAKTLFEFEPYHWGPWSRHVYQSLDALVAKGLVATELVAGQSWSLYKATPAGTEAAKRLAAQTDQATVDCLLAQRDHVMALSFRQLLRDVYTRYPEFAANSVAKDLAR